MIDINVAMGRCALVRHATVCLFFSVVLHGCVLEYINLVILPNGGVYLIFKYFLTGVVV